MIFEILNIYPKKLLRFILDYKYVFIIFCNCNNIYIFNYQLTSNN